MSYGDYRDPLPGETSDAYWSRMTEHEKRHGINPLDGAIHWPTPHWSGDRVGEECVEFRLCCPAIRRAARVDPRGEGARAPHMGHKGPVVIHGHEESIWRDPVRFCPWCGREILPRDSRIARLWELRRRLAEAERVAEGLHDPAVRGLNEDERDRLRGEIAGLERPGSDKVNE